MNVLLLRIQEQFMLFFVKTLISSLHKRSPGKHPREGEKPAIQRQPAVIFKKGIRTSPKTNGNKKQTLNREEGKKQTR